MKLLIATRNKHKVQEIQQILQAPHLLLVSADEIPGLPEDVKEDAETFEGNALTKARTLCKASGLWTLADDSGLEVDALNGEPGVRSARYAGEPSDTSANNAKLLRALADKADRHGHFTCVIALCAPDGREWTVRGQCPGTILDHPQGDNGFGYDPLFVPNGYSKTFAELDPHVKNSISHRARALQKALAEWKSLLY